MDKNEELVFLFIDEENRTRTTRRIFKLIASLDQLKMEGRPPEEKETPLSLLRKPEYKPKFIIINIDHPDLKVIINSCRDLHPSIPIIALYDSGNMEKLQEIEEKYHIKYELDRSAISDFSLNNLFLKIKSEKAFNQKNSNNMRYTLLQSLGGGASSIVDLYFDIVLDRKVAVKKIRVEGMKQIEKEKVKKEVENMKSIKVPTSIEFYDFEIENDNRFIYMEFADHGTLEKKINQHKRNGTSFLTEEIFDYMIEIMLALYVLNKKGMMHRDIKSENILLKEEKFSDGKHVIAKLSDLGISRQIDGVVGSLTLCGTPYYVSPEIAAGEKRYDYNADIWSLGVVLYELISLNKPWYDPKMSTKELFSLVFTTKYPGLPANTDEKLKYLVSIMLKKDPTRRANLFEILKLDFMYEKVIKLIKKYEWENVEDFKSIKELESDLHPCYLFMDIVPQDVFNHLIDGSKLCMYSIPNDYKVSLLGGTVKARKGDQLLSTYDDVITWENETLYSKEGHKQCFSHLLKNKILISLSHTMKDVDQFVINFLNNPSAYYFQFTFNESDSPTTGIDNVPLCSSNLTSNNFDYLALSQLILKQGKLLYKDIKNNKIEQVQIVCDIRYLKFLHGISYFQSCDLFKLEHTIDNQTRLAFLLNVYQIMYIHHLFHVYLNKTRVKSGMLSYFQYDIGISYKFRNFTLTDIEMKNVVFRGNKPPPGSYMRLVYASDPKCQLLPNFDKTQALLIMSEFNNEMPDTCFKIFNQKEIDEQLNDITFNFIQNYISFQTDELVLPAHIMPLLNDFGSNNTPDFPEGFLQFILINLNAHKEFTSPNSTQNYKVRISENNMKSLEFLNQKFLRDINAGMIKVSYLNLI